MPELADLLLHGQVVELLVDAPEALATTGREHRAGSDSLVMRDCGEAEAASEASRVTMMLSATAAEQLQGVGAMLAMIHPTLAHQPLLRSVLEAAARVHWILDGADAVARAQRAWLQLLVSRGLEMKAHRNARNPGVMSTVPERLEQTVIQIVDHFGEEPDMTRKNPSHWRVGNHEIPEFGKSLDALLTTAVPGFDGATMYRIYCLTSHPGTTSWAYAAFDKERGIAQLVPNLNRLARETLSVAYIWIHTTMEVCRYHGFLEDRPREWKQAVLRLSQMANMGSE